VSNCRLIEVCTLCHLYIDCVEMVGSTHFAAPEVLVRTSYSGAADVWSAGVLMYLLLCGYLPFDGDQLCESICRGAFDVRVASANTTAATVATSAFHLTSLLLI